jgi:uncharacterized protein YhfF
MSAVAGDVRKKYEPGLEATVSELPEIDRLQVAAFWQRYLTTSRTDPATPVPTCVEPFGDSSELAESLLALVLHGPKRATAGAVVDYTRQGDPIPYVGRLSIATDGAGYARAVLRTTEVRVGPLSSVDDAFAWVEGEGDRTRTDWLRGHEAFFRRSLPTIGEVFTPDLETVFERFEVVYQE